MEMTESRISELEEINQLEEGGGAREGTKNWVMSCGTISKGLTYRTRIPKGKERMKQKNYLRKNAWKLPKFGERHAYVDLRSLANTKQDKFK